MKGVREHQVVDSAAGFAGEGLEPRDRRRRVVGDPKCFHRRLKFGSDVGGTVQGIEYICPVDIHVATPFRQSRGQLGMYGNYNMFAAAQGASAVGFFRLQELSFVG